MLYSTPFCRRTTFIICIVTILDFKPKSCSTSPSSSSWLLPVEEGRRQAYFIQHCLVIQYFFWSHKTLATYKRLKAIMHCMWVYARYKIHLHLYRMYQRLYQKVLLFGLVIMLRQWAQGINHALYHLLPWYEISVDIKWKHQNWQCPTNNQIIWNCLLLAKIEIYLSDKLQDFPNKTLKVKYCCASGGLIKSFYNSIDFKLQLREPFKNYLADFVR